ncbi:MAG: DNA-3-methyladenine glycosylase [Fuerstiella sp.]|nr:DNA-3-methyladenine glycosylase [Fuerstiella sp.]
MSRRPSSHSGALEQHFFARDVTVVARDLIGMLLCRRNRRGLTVGRIAETEAYLAQGDSASHSFNGINRKNASMFGPPGRAYIYTIHARQCFNIVTELTGVASAVLIRAVEPMHGIRLMEQRRSTCIKRDLCRGPARLCEAFDTGGDFDGWDLTRQCRLWVATDSAGDDFRISNSPRIGVTSAKDARLRFFLTGNKFVSGPKALNR